MKKTKRNLFIFLLSLTTLGLFWGCKSETDSQNGDQTETASDDEDNHGKNSRSNIAISLWDKGSLRDGSGNGAKWINSVSFGEEVTLLGDTIFIPEEDRTYWKVKLSDGQTGWVHSYLFAKGAETAAILNSAMLYKRPDPLTATDKKLEHGDVVAVTANHEDGWMHVYGKEKKKVGWVKVGEGLTRDKSDIAAAVMMNRAMAETSPTKRKEKLSAILSNPDMDASAFAQNIQSLLDEEMAEPVAASDELVITGDRVNIRREPSTTGDNIAFQLDQGSVCKVIKKGKMEEIKGNKDYWYNISYNGEEGWVFGSITSRKQN